MKSLTTVQEAREEISSFLQDTGCYEICAECPVYGEEGCCSGCEHLVKGKGCSNPNLSCLTYTCSVLNMHLLNQEDEVYGNKLYSLSKKAYGLPREGYRGCDLLDADQTIVLEDPLEINKSLLCQRKA